MCKAIVLLATIDHYDLQKLLVEDVEARCFYVKQAMKNGIKEHYPRLGKSSPQNLRKTLKTTLKPAQNHPRSKPESRARVFRRTLKRWAQTDKTLASYEGLKQSTSSEGGVEAKKWEKLTWQGPIFRPKLRTMRSDLDETWWKFTAPTCPNFLRTSDTFKIASNLQNLSF